MFPQFPEDKLTKKLHKDSSPITPSDELCDRMLRNVLSATTQTDSDISFTEVMNTLKIVEARERRSRCLTIMGAVAAVFVVGVFVLLQGPGPVGDNAVIIVDEQVPLSGSTAPDALLPHYNTEVHTADGADAKWDPRAALRGLRRERGQLYFYFENEADGKSWKAVSAVSASDKHTEIAAQEVEAAPALVRFPFPESGLDILVESAGGEQAVLEIRPA